MTLPVLPPRTLILGGARSGKSALAEKMIGDRPAFYIATSQIFDDEMAQRIDQHRERRGDTWHTIEEPMDLAGVLDNLDTLGAPVLVDCLTLWLTNVLLANKDVAVESARLTGILSRLPGPIILVANEVGLGIVPENKLARLFRDHAGRLNQDIAAIAEKVVFVAAGLPLILKDQTPCPHP